jgi:hypothetical protein
VQVSTSSGCTRECTRPVRKCALTHKQPSKCCSPTRTRCSWVTVKGRWCCLYPSWKCSVSWASKCLRDVRESWMGTRHKPHACTHACMHARTHTHARTHHTHTHTHTHTLHHCDVKVQERLRPSSRANCHACELGRLGRNVGPRVSPRHPRARHHSSMWGQRLVVRRSSS